MKESINQALDHAEKFARSRFAHNLSPKFKINGKKFIEEMHICHVVGEMAGAERILRLMDDTTLDLETLKGEIHIFLTDLNNGLSKKYGLNHSIKVDDFVNGRFGPKLTSSVDSQASTMH